MVITARAFSEEKHTISVYFCNSSTRWCHDFFNYYFLIKIGLSPENINLFTYADRIWTQNLGLPFSICHRKRTYLRTADGLSKVYGTLAIIPRHWEEHFQRVLQWLQYKNCFCKTFSKHCFRKSLQIEHTSNYDHCRACPSCYLVPVQY